MIGRSLGVLTQDHGRILLISLTLCSLATAGAVWWYYERQLAAMEDQVINELRAVSDNKAKQIVNWRNERLGDAHILMAPPIMQTAEKILSGRGDANDSAALGEVLRSVEEAFLYSGAALCDLDGKVHMTSGHVAADPVRLRRFVRQPVGATGPQLSDLSLDPQSGRPLMALIVPVRQKGALILDVDPQRFLYPYLKAWSGHSQSAETFLVRSEDDDFVTVLSDLRYHPDAPLRFRQSIKGLPIPDDKAIEAGAVFRHIDYRQVPAIAILSHIPDSRWFMVVKIDAAEADAPEHRLGWEMAIITGLIALLNVAGAAVVWRGRSARIQQEKLEWFYAIANDTPAYLWMADPKMENAFLNAPLAKYLGTGESKLREAWTDAVHPDDADRARSTFREHMKNHTGYTHEYRVRRYDGEYRWVVSQAVPRFSADGTFLGFAGSLLDVNGRRLAEKRLREANKRLQELSSRLIGAQEEERKRLARELHDDLSQQIAALSLATGNLKRQIPAERAEARAQADAIHGKLVNLAEGVRRMSHELHPAVLQYSGLEAALRSYCEEFGALTGLEIDLKIEGSFDGVSPDAALCLFRVTQEALRNVVKHAQVSQASVELRRAERVLTLKIADSGVGMDTASRGSKGLGLLNIQERARLVGGKVGVRSAPGIGTSVTVEVPET
jgi:two-component system, NarL family, sensor histidine kinase UhpB